MYCKKSGVTPLFTVKDVMDIPVMDQALLLTAYEASKQNQVEWVSIIEAPVEDFVRKNEVVLTTGIGYKDHIKSLLTFVQEVREAGAAALVVSIGHYIPQLPESVISYCSEHKFPLVQLPWDVRFSEVTQQISSALNQEERDAVKRSDGIRKELLEIVLRGEGLGEITTYLQQQLEMPVIVTDRRGRLKHQTRNAERLKSLWNEYLLNQGDPLSYSFEDGVEAGSLPSNMHWISTSDSSILQLTVQTAREIQGFILIQWPSKGIKAEKELLDHLILLEHTATTSALCFLHDQTALETELRLKDDFVWSLAKGTFESLDDALSRAKSLHYDLDTEYLCLIAKPENNNQLFKHGNHASHSYSTWLRSIGDVLEEETYHAGRTMNIKTMSTFQKEELIIFVELFTEKSIETAYPFIDLLQYRLEQKNPQAVVSWGVAKTYGRYCFNVSFQEAKAALDIGHAHKEKGFISTYADTRFDRALFAMTENEELEEITEITIAPLRKYSKERGIDLVHTFVVYNQHKGNVSQTARALNLHRQSLLYRLKKIENLTGCSLDDSDELFLIDLSVRLHMLRSGTPYGLSSLH